MVSPPVLSSSGTAENIVTTRDLLPILEQLFQDLNGLNVPGSPDNWYNINFGQTFSDSSFPALRASTVGNLCSPGLKNSCGTGFTVFCEWNLSCPYPSLGSLFWSLSLSQASFLLSPSNCRRLLFLRTWPRLSPQMTAHPVPLSSPVVMLLFRQTEVHKLIMSLLLSALDLRI